MTATPHIKPRLLLVEDYPTTRVVLAQLLSNAGYQVAQASSGEQALELLETQIFDIVLTDVVMGEVDGIEVLHKAKIQPYNPVVILLTGYGTLETCMAALRLGAFNYLLKPCPEEELLTCISNGLRQRFQEQQVHQAIQTLSEVFMSRDVADPLSIQQSQYIANKCASGMRYIGELCIGESRQKVLFKGNPINPTPTEYALLWCLAETVGEARPYHEIVRYTHQIEIADTDALKLLRPHVRNLRKKLTDAYIVHDHGMGYKLVNPEEG
jgi:DNA-binding response OmpR family regulator